MFTEYSNRNLCRGRIPKPGHSRCHGLTLFEALVAAALTLLLLHMIVTLLVPTMRYSVKGSVTAEIQQESLRAINKISDDLEMSCAGGVSLSIPASNPERGPVYLGIIRLQDTLPDGSKVWEKALIVYSWNGPGRPLIRKVWNESTPPSISIPLSSSIPSRYPESVLTSIASEAALQGQILARDVNDFRITCARADDVSSPIGILMELRRQAATGGINIVRFQISKTINMRNQL